MSTMSEEIPEWAIVRVERRTRARQHIENRRRRGARVECLHVGVCADVGGDIEAAHTRAHASSLEKHPLQHPGQRQR